MRFLYLSILCAALVAPSSVFSIENDKPVLRIEEAMRVWQERWLAISGAGQPLGTRNPNRERSGTTPADVFDGPIEWPARKFDGVLPGAYPAECFYKEDLLQPNLAASLVAQLRSKIATCLGAAVAPSAGDQGGIILPFDPYWDHLTPDTQGNNYGGGSIAVYMVELEEGNPVPLLRAPDASRMFKVYDEDSGQWVFPDVSVEPWKSMIDGSVTIENYEQRFEELVEFIQMPMRMNSYFTQVNAQEPIVRNWNFDFFHPDIYRLDCDSCYACAKDCIPGDLNCAAMNASLTIGLGGSVNGPVGALLLNIETPNDLFASPRNLDVMFEAAMLPRDLTNFDNNSDAYIISALVNGVNQPRQIKTPVGLVDIVADAANPDQKYTLYFYDNDNIGALSNGLFTVSPANAYVSIEFEGSGYQTTVQELKVTRTVTGNQSEEIIFSFDTATHTWSYTQGEGDDQRTRVTQRTWIQGDGTQIGDVVQLKTNTLDHKQVVVSSAARKYKIFPWNTDASGSPTSSKSRQYELIEVIEDPDGIARKTTYHYDETDYGSYSANQSVKRLQRVEYPDLSWQSVEYDNYGRWENVYTPFGESTSKEGDHRKTSYEYSEPDSETTLLQRTESTVISGIEQITSRSWTKRRTEGLYTVTTQETAFSESALEGDVANQRFVSREYRLGEHAGRVERSVQADDSVTLYSYDENVNGELTTVVESGTPDDTSDPMAATTVTDGTRTTTITNPQGKVMSRTVVDVESGHTIDSWLATGFDSYGRITSSLHHDGTQDSFVFGCCGLETKTDRNGLMTTYIYDSLDRVYEEFSHPAGEPDNKYHHVRYKYDAEGRLKKTTRLKTKESLDASLPVSIVSEERIYDETGDLSSTKDTRGTTSYSEEVVDGKLQRTTTYPNLTTRIETYLPTGELQSISGTAVAPMKYEYGIDADGRFTKEIRIGDGGAETEWVKSYVDFAGRHYKTVFADNAEVVNTYYPMDDANAERRGKLKSNVQPPDSNDGGAVGVTMLYDYDADGKGSVTAVDMNQNGVIDYAGPDRITRSESDLVEITRDSVTAVVRQSKTMIWETDGVDQSREVSVSEQSIDGLHSWNTVNGLTTYTARTFTTAVDSTVVTTLPDLSTTTQTLKAGRLSSSVKATSGAEVIQSTSLSYDGYGRLEVSSDVWAGDTIYTYELDDQVKTITTPDPDPSASGVGKDAQVTTYLYDEMGRPDTVIRPDGSRTYSKYNDRGLLWRTYGAGTFPQEMIYDAQGRLKTLSTWQEFIDESSFDVSEGKATTTWIYDSVRGWLNSKRYADAQGPSYTYYPSGKLHTRTWARGVVTTYGYNAAGQLTTTDYSDSTPDVTQTYDRAGKPSTIQDAAGLLTYAYTAEGLLDTETYDGSGLIPASVMDRGYDALLRPNHLDVSESANTVQQIGYAYDEASRLQTVSSGLLDSTYAYVPNTSLIDTVTHRNDGVTQMTVTNTHDKLGRLVNVLSNPSASLAISVLYEFNDLNQRTKMTREDNSYWSYDYDDLGQVTDAHKKDSSGEMIPGFDFGIKYDDIGNRRSATRRNAGNDEDVVQKYTSNLLNQYSARSVPNLIDVVGSANADAQVLVNGKQATRSGDLFHKQLVVDNTSDAQWFPLDVIAHDSVAGTYRKESGHQFLPLNPVEPKYDEDGNLTQDARWDYTWDGENRLIAMETLSTVVTAGVPQQKLEFAYDGQSRRIQKKVSIWTGSSWMPDQDTRFIWDGWNLIVELDGLNTYSAVNTYVWGLDLSGSMQGAGGVGGLLFAETATGSSIPAYDGNGNVLAYVDASNGVIEAEYEYGVFGETTKTESETADDFNFQFSTKYVDAETRLYYYGYRFYDPEVGRWISRDPIGEMGGLNLYGFVRNGPIDMIDFFGLKDYSPGDTDPPLASDPGSGIYNSVTPTFRYRVMEQTVRAAGLFSGMPNARKHLYHYLGNSGADLTIDFEDMLDTVPDERRLMMREADLARVYVETLADGKHTFTSRSKSIGNVRKDESEDWHYATAGYEYWGQGTVEISGEGKCFSMSFTYKMSDTYNWDAGKAVRFKIPKGSGWLVQSAVGTSGPVRRAPNNVLVVEDKAMAQLHLMGLAKEFVQYGEVQKKYTWTKGDARMTEVKDNIGTKNK